MAAEALQLTFSERPARLHRPEDDAWRPVRGMAELVSLVRGPDFATEGENIWLLREDQAFRGRLVIDDPTVLVTGQ